MHLFFTRHVTRLTLRAVGGGEARTLHGQRWVAAGGLGNDEAEVVGEAVRKPLMPVRGGIGMSERGLHPDVTIAHLDRADRRVVCAEVEGAATFEIEASVMPVTRSRCRPRRCRARAGSPCAGTIVEGEDAPRGRR